MNQKRILQFTGMTCTKFGSLEHYLVNIVKLCNKSEYKTVFQYETYPQSKAYVEELTRENIEIKVKPTYTNPIKVFLNCLSLISSVKPTIIHIHFVSKYAKFFIPIIAKIYGVKKVISTVHNKPYYTKKHPIRFIYNLYDHILPVSNAVRKSLIIGGVDEKRATTLYLGLFGERKRDPDLKTQLRNQFNIPQDAIVLGCIAFDAEFKGNDILIEAISKITGFDKNIYLISVGVNPIESNLPQLAQRLKVSDQIRWAGIVDNGCKILNAVDIYVQPSRAEEGLPLAIMEALSMKFPVVCTSVSGNVEAINDGLNGIVTPADAEGLAHGIEKMISIQAKWNDLGEQSYNQYLKLFKGDESVKKLVEQFYGISN